MQFNKTWEKVLSGEKVATRRIVKPTDMFTTALAQIVIGKDAGRVIHTVPTPINALSRNNHVYSVVSGKRVVYEVGKTYAVQPGRTKPAIYWRYSDMTGTGYEVLQQPYSPELANWGWKQARIRITDIRRELVGAISAEDVKAEGFDSYAAFMLTWISMHDKEAVNSGEFVMSKYVSASALDDALLARVASRPKERYDAWVLTFELSK